MGGDPGSGGGGLTVYAAFTTANAFRAMPSETETVSRMSVALCDSRLLPVTTTATVIPRMLTALSCSWEDSTPRRSERRVVFTTGAAVSADEDWSSSCEMLKAVSSESRWRRLSETSTPQSSPPARGQRVSCKPAATCSVVMAAGTVALSEDS